MTNTLNAFTMSGDITVGAYNINMTGSLGATGARLAHGWFTNLTVSNTISGSISGNAATVSTNANLTGAVTSIGNATALGSFSSSNLYSALTDKTGTGSAVFAASPTFTGTPVITATTDVAVEVRSTGTGAALINLRAGNATSSSKYAYINLFNDDTNAQKYALGTYGSDTFMFYDVKAAKQRLAIDPSGNVAIGNAALATTATDGFLYIPTCAGTPTGTPTSFSGRVPIIYDTTNNRLKIYNGGAWKSIQAS